MLVQDEEWMVADGLEVAVVGRLLLRAMDRTLGAVAIQDQTPRERAAASCCTRAGLRRRSP